MAMITRHLRKTLRNAAKSDDDFDEETPRSVFGCRTNCTHRPPQSSIHTSRTVLDALSDKNSELARFLFVGTDGGNQEEDKSAWFQSFRRPKNASSNDDGMTSMGMYSSTSFYALALEPMDIRNERIIMLFEAYAIFGALFMGAIWMLYEFGSPNGYGGEGGHPMVHRAFGCVMAVALGVNGLLALFGALLWIVSINLNSSHQDYVFESRKALTYLDALLLMTLKLFIIGLVLGIYLNLSPYWPEAIIAGVIVVVIYVRGFQISWNHMMAVAPLECFHMTPTISVLPKFLSCKSGNKLKADAIKRARELRERAYRERKTIDPNFRGSRSSDSSSIGGLLRTAAVHLGMIDYDVSTYTDRLKEDWFHEADHLKDRSVECLSRYMPLRLAEEVQRLLEAESSEEIESVKLKSIYVGVRRRSDEVN